MSLLSLSNCRSFRTILNRSRLRLFTLALTRPAHVGSLPFTLPLLLQNGAFLRSQHRPRVYPARPLRNAAVFPCRYKSTQTKMEPQLSGLLTSSSIPQPQVLVAAPATEKSPVGAGGPMKRRNLILCFDGTANQYDGDVSPPIPIRSIIVRVPNRDHSFRIPMLSSSIPC